MVNVNSDEKQTVENSECHRCDSVAMLENIPKNSPLFVLFDPVSKYPPLRLKLGDPNFLLDKLPIQIPQRVNNLKVKSNEEDIILPSSLEKVKASNFAAIYLKIGTWQRQTMCPNDIVAKCYYAKKKLVWEFLDNTLKKKIEIQWDSILCIRAITKENQYGILEIELNNPPSLYHELPPQPRKHTQWAISEDFTFGQALKCRRHLIQFAPGVLDKHYKNLLHYDTRMNQCSKIPFPSLESSFFESFSITGYHHSINGQLDAPNPRFCEPQPATQISLTSPIPSENQMMNGQNSLAPSPYMIQALSHQTFNQTTFSRGIHTLHSGFPQMYYGSPILNQTAVTREHESFSRGFHVLNQTTCTEESGSKNPDFEISNHKRFTGRKHEFNHIKMDTCVKPFEGINSSSITLVDPLQQLFLNTGMHTTLDETNFKESFLGDTQVNPYFHYQKHHTLQNETCNYNRQAQSDFGSKQQQSNFSIIDQYFNVNNLCNSHISNWDANQLINENNGDLNIIFQSLCDNENQAWSEIQHSNSLDLENTVMNLDATQVNTTSYTNTSNMSADNQFFKVSANIVSNSGNEQFEDQNFGHPQPYLGNHCFFV